jgi:hypothetical protein
MFRGPGSECEMLDDLLGPARERRSGASLLPGEPGIDNTALLEPAIASARDAMDLRAVGAYEESLRVESQRTLTVGVDTPTVRSTRG